MSADLLALHLRAAGIAFEREVRFHPKRRWRFDFALRDRMLAIEVDGGGFIRGRHHRALGFAQDLEKLNEAALLGWTVLRFTPQMVKSGCALQTIERALGRRGKKAGS